MAPFPETEIMTIKRLEVALRKNDYKLLKDGAYKLHEKYHSGFKFEYLDLLKDLFVEITNNATIPSDIKDILTPTIEDILSSQGIQTDVAMSPHESLNQDRVSSLTSLSYSTAQKTHEETKINAFNAFGSNNASSQPQKVFSQSPFSAEPFKEYTPQSNSINQINMQSESPALIHQTPVQETTFMQASQVATIQEEKEQIQEEKEQIQEEIQEEIQNEVVEENKKEPKSIAIFYSQDSSIDKIKNILKYREMISKIKDEHISISEILNLISEINVQSNTNVFELRNLLEQIRAKNSKASLITNSMSANLIGLLDELNIKYEMFESKEENDINLLPILGLTNLFKCSECNQEYLDKDSKVLPLILQCPKCKKAMYPEFYATTKLSCEINVDYYNQSVVALANSKVWLLIHPSLEEKLSINLLKSALMVSNQVEEIYIIDKDINVRETYKNIFNDIKNDIKISAQINTIEEFFTSLD